MLFECLASSSAGNCYYIEMAREGATPVRLLLEVGLPYMEIARKAMLQGIDISKVNAVLVTHGHMDHARACDAFISRRKAVFANEDIISKYFGSNTNILKHNESKMLAADTKVLPISVEHDAPDSLGFVISTSKETILFINDCKLFKADISKIPFDYICIEANYDGQILHFAYEEAKKNNDYANIKRYERLFDSHMSLAHCRDHLKQLNLFKCKAIFLMHLSDRHANENKFKNEVKEATGINTYVCKKNGGIV